MKKIYFFLIVAFAMGLAAGVTETTKKEITRKYSRELTQNRIYQCKFIGFAGRDGSGSFTNDINQMEPGSVYVIKSGIIHRGKKDYLIPWSQIKTIDRDKLAGSSSSILIRTLVGTEKLKLVDPKQVGNLDTLDTSMDSLLRVLQKTFKQYKKNPEQFAVLPEKPTAPPLPPKTSLPPQPVIKKEPVKTKEVKVGMTFTEVESVLGAPLKKVVLTEKVIYKYTDMIITFKDGKMVDAVVK